MKEISQRFDFKGSVSSINNEENKKMVVVSDDEFKHIVSTVLGGLV